MKIFFKNSIAVIILSIIAFTYGYFIDPYKEGELALVLVSLVNALYFISLSLILIVRFTSKKGDVRGIAISLLAPVIIFILFNFVIPMMVPLLF